MKDDAPSPWLRILLTGGFHRPCQFEHEITSASCTTTSWDGLWARRGKRERDRTSVVASAAGRRGKDGETTGTRRTVATGRKVAGLRDQLLSFQLVVAWILMAGFALYVTVRQQRDNPLPKPTSNRPLRPSLRRSTRWPLGRTATSSSPSSSSTTTSAYRRITAR